jgi:hypothetical protein
MMEKFIKYTEKLEYITVVFLLRFHNFKERINNHNLKVYLGLYVLILLYFQWYYVSVLLRLSQNPLFLNIIVFLLIAPTALVTIILIRTLIFVINPKHKRYGKQTLDVKKELLKKYKLKRRKNINIPSKNKLILKEDYSHTDIANELVKLHKNNVELVKPFVYRYFKTNDYRQRFRTFFTNKQIPQIGVSKEVYIEFYWVLYKSGIIKNSFAEISKLLANTFGKEKNSSLYKIKSSTIEKYPSERNFEKKYTKEPSIRSFFNKNPK